MLENFFSGDDNQTLNELFTKIKNYSNIWKEQEKCLLLIKEYEKWKKI